MWPHTPPRVLKFALPTIAALGAGAAVGVAAIPSAGPFRACVLNTAQAPLPKGAVRILDSGSEQCNSDETAVTWAQEGPSGPAGAQGPQGDPGPAGSDAVGSNDSSSSSNDDTFSTPTQAGGPSADMFLKLDGVAGDSTDDKHKGEIDVTSFAFSLGRGGDGTGSGGRAPSGSSGKGATKGRLRTLRIDKVYDASSPKLFRAAATGQHIKSAVLSFRRSNDSGDLEFLTYALTDVQVTSYDQGGKDGDSRDLGSLEEEVGLAAAHVHVTERTANADDPDKPGAVVAAGWTVPKRPG